MLLKFRAECYNDVEKLLNLLLQKDDLKSFNIFHWKGYPDVTVLIETKVYDRKQVIEIMKQLEDSHIMQRTIQTPEKYKEFQGNKCKK